MRHVLGSVGHILAGGLAYAIGIATAPEVLHLLPPVPAGILRAVGVLVAVTGIAHRLHVAASS